MSSIEDKRTRLAELEATLAEIGSVTTGQLAEEVRKLKLDIGRETGEGPFGCRTCGSDQIVAWYPVYERQGINIIAYDGDVLEVEYDGCTRQADEAGENEEYRCLSCDDSAETLEELVGLSRPESTPLYSDAQALDELNLLLSSPDWPGASGMEDVCDIVRFTGREEVPDAPMWYPH